MKHLLISNQFVPPGVFMDEVLAFFMLKKLAKILCYNISIVDPLDYLDYKR